MKKTTCLLFAICFFRFCQISHAQVVGIDELRTPTSPGFILMDETPASIERPSTPQGLALNLLSLRQGGALEFSPFWLKSHPDLTFDKYISKKSDWPILKNLSLSVATTNVSDTINLAIGFRTDLFRYRTSGNIAEIKNVRDKIQTELNEDEPNAEVIGDLRKELYTAMRPAILAELAGAYLGQSSDGSYENLQKARAGIWINVSVKPVASMPGEVILLARYLDNHEFGDYEIDSEIIDFGLRALYNIRSASISAEFVQRSIVDGDSFDRLAGILEYKINDNLYITGTFGQDFNPQSDILVLFGLNIGISGKTFVK
jgi:hypothetical protein